MKFSRFKFRGLKKSPANIFAGNVLSRSKPTKRVCQVIESIGADRVIFASDYPHWDATFPGVTDMILAREDLSAETKRKIMGENAAALLKLD